MYIDSPNFPRRKIVNKVQSNDSYSYGLERIKLANFVAQELNENHKRDAQILEKFTRQAQQFKRKKLHGKLNLNYPTKSQINLKPMDFDYIEKPLPFPQKMTTSQSVNIIDHTQQSPQPVQKKIFMREVSTLTDVNNDIILKNLHLKDKKIHKQEVQIKKNEKQMKKLQERMKRLQRIQIQKQREKNQALEKQTFDKLRKLVNSVTNQLVENQSLIANNLQNIKKRQSYHKQYENIPLSESKYFSPRPRSKTPFVMKPKRAIPNIEQQYNNPELLPKITYRFSVKNNILNDENKRKKELDMYISDLQKSRNRLDSLQV